MKRIIQILVIFFVQFTWSQNDFSESSQDFYSYNIVKNFIKIENEIITVVDNAIFKFNIIENKRGKISSINGLLGETTTSIFYSKEFQKIIVGYNTGLIEIKDATENLVYKTNIKEGEDLYGGKVIWNKINLAVSKVASGIYIDYFQQMKILKQRLLKLLLLTKND